MYEGHKIIALCISRANSERNLEFIQALNKACIENKSRLFIFHSCTDFYHWTRWEEGEKSVFDLLDFDIIDAVVLFDETFDDKRVTDNIADFAVAKGIPLICVGADREKAINFLFEYESGFEQVVRHAIEYHGMKNPCLIAGRKGEPLSEKRIAVYKKVLEENSIDFKEDRLFYGDYWWMPTRNSIDKIIASGDIPDAVICANDSMAVAACEYLKKKGYQIPDDIIVTGFDGTKEAKCCNPPITTAKCNLEATAADIVEVVENILQGRQVNKQYNVSFVLDVYCSCGCNISVQVDTDELLRSSEGRFFRYQNDERTFYEMSEKVIECKGPQDIIKLIDTSNLYSNCIIVNSDCLEESINPTKNKREKSYDDEMELIYLSHADISGYPQLFYRKNIIPNLYHTVIENDKPLIFNAISFFGVPMGYVCFWFETDLENYAKINQFVTSLNNIIGSYRTVKYLEYVADSVEQMSARDFMTDMANRKGFYKMLPTIIEKAEQEKKQILVASIDIDGLKYINDNFGHEEGDFAIKSIADTVKKVDFCDIIFGRFGGDELVACAVCDGEKDEIRFKNDVLQQLKDLNEKVSKPYAVSASIGVYVVSPKNLDFEAALKVSDDRMYIMKTGQPNRRKN